uniref:Uncharacterized protein n=1 Tax=Alexandrium monilatum TaxID=311494 RepID=A0A7S4QMV4_9DINO
MATPLNNPFGAGAAAAGGSTPIRSSPFGAPGASAAAAPLSAGPPLGPFGGAPGGGVGGPSLPPPPTAGEVRARQDAVPPPPAAASPFPGSTGMEPPPSAFSGGATPGGRPPTAFYPTADPAMAGGPPAPAQPQPPGQDAHSAAVQSEIEQFNSPPHFVRGSVARPPSSASGKQRLSIPLGIVIQPLAPLPPDMEDVRAVNHAAVGTIVRCKSCRTYINPFVHWESNGRRWSCNICGFSQMTQDSYFASLDQAGKRMDRFERPELCRGAVEYIAPAEYMVRPPQPPVFMFVIDVSYTAVVTGMLDTVVSAIKDVIQKGAIPGGQRAQVGILTFDTSLHFYNLSSNLSQPQMLVVSDLEDLFLPLPEGILAPLGDSESAITSLLESLPAVFQETRINESCMGSAVKGAYLAMKHIGGKMVVCGACIPSVGEFALKSTRDNPRLLGTEREVELLRPTGTGFKDLATEMTKVQISVEVFMAPQQYVDLASIAPLAKLTGGDIHYYPQFHIQHSGVKLTSELTHMLTRYQGWEAVMRIRVSRGWKITKFFGHLSIRGSDLLVVPCCHADQTFAIAVDMEENTTPDPVLHVQSALLYTNSDGERRIRVNTWAALTTQHHQEVISSVDVQAAVAMLTHQALDTSLTSNLPDARNRLQTQCQQIIQSSQTCPNAEVAQFLPLYILGMLKSPAFRATNDIPADLRAYVWSRLETLSVPQMAAYYNPRMMGLHNLAEGCGVPDGMGRVTLPDMLNLTSESMTQDGVYLLEDGDTMYVWIGRAVDTAFVQAVFGASSFDQLDGNAAAGVIGTRGDPLSSKIGHIIRQVRLERPLPYMTLSVIRTGDPIEGRFFASLIEDRTTGLQSTYAEFLTRMGYRPQQQQPGMPQAPPMAMR